MKFKLNFTHWNKTNVHQQPVKPNPKLLKVWNQEMRYKYAENRKNRTLMIQIFHVF